MSFFTSTDENEKKYILIFSPLIPKSNTSAHNSPHMSDEEISPFLKAQFVNFLMNLLHRNMVAYRNGKSIPNEDVAIEMTLRRKYPQDFWNVRDFSVLAVCLLEKENWKLPLAN